MSQLTRKQLHQTLKKGDIKPVYVLYGEETYLRNLAARTIADMCLAECGFRAFNDSVFSLLHSTLHHALATAEQFPMMFGRRVITITDLAKLDEADEDHLMRYLQRPVESSIVVIVAETLDKRRKITKALFETCAVEFTRLGDSELREWATKRLKDLKVEADASTVHNIVALVGNDVRTLSNELDKLATAALDSGRITDDLVDSLVGRSRELSNFDLADQLIARDRKRALETLGRLLDDGAEPVMLVGLIASNYHRLALAKDLMSRGASDFEISKQVGIFGNRGAFMATARRSEMAQLTKSIERIAQADLAIKTSLGGSGQQGSRLQLELLVCELAA